MLNLCWWIKGHVLQIYTNGSLRNQLSVNMANNRPWTRVDKCPLTKLFGVQSVSFVIKKGRVSSWEMLNGRNMTKGDAGWVSGRRVNYRGYRWRLSLVGCCKSEYKMYDTSASTCSSLSICSLTSFTPSPSPMPPPSMSSNLVAPSFDVSSENSAGTQKP